MPNEFDDRARLDTHLNRHVLAVTAEQDSRTRPARRGSNWLPAQRSTSSRPAATVRARPKRPPVGRLRQSYRKAQRFVRSSGMSSPAKSARVSVPIPTLMVMPDCSNNRDKARLGRVASPEQRHLQHENGGYVSLPAVSCSVFRITCDGRLVLPTSCARPATSASQHVSSSQSASDSECSAQTSDAVNMFTRTWAAPSSRSSALTPSSKR